MLNEKVWENCPGWNKYVSYVFYKSLTLPRYSCGLWNVPTTTMDDVSTSCPINEPTTAIHPSRSSSLSRWHKSFLLSPRQKKHIALIGRSLVSWLKLVHSQSTALTRLQKGTKGPTKWTRPPLMNNNVRNSGRHWHHRHILSIRNEDAYCDWGTLYPAQRCVAL